jgi:flavin-dependent dehydrogenase
MVMSRWVDVAVIGGGVAGLCAGIAAAGHGLSSVIFDTTGAEATRQGIETLEPRVPRLLADLGAGAVLASAGARLSPGTLVAWGASEPLSRDSILDPHGDAVHVDRRALRTALVSAANSAGVALRLGCAVRFRGMPDGGGWLIGSDDTATAARFLIIATGRQNSVAPPPARHYVVDRLVAVIAEAMPVAGMNSLEPRLVVEAAPDGWWYAAPARDGRLQIVFLTDSDIWRRMPGSAADRLKDLTRTSPLIQSLIGTDLSVTCAVAANTTVCLPAAGHQWIAIGDAALAFDPLSGRGVLHALTSALVAADIAAAPQDRRASLTETYARDVEQRFASFLIMRTRHYGREERWGDHTFWRRRCEPPS